MLHRHRDAEQPERRHLRQQPPVEAMGPIEVADARGHLAAGPFAHRLLYQPVFLGELEIHQAPAPGAEGSTALRNSTSRCWLFSRNCSVMRSGSNIRWMSRF